MDTTADTAASGATLAPRGLKKPLLLAFACVNVLAIVGAVYSVLAMSGGGGPTAALSASDEAEDESSEAGDSEDGAEDEGEGRSETAPIEASAASRKKGRVINLDSFVVNLADLETPRYLKVDIALEVNDSGGKKDIDGNSARVRDAVLAYLTGLTTEQTMGPLGKSDMRFALKKRVNKVLPSPAVKQVYFTQFIVH